MIQNGSMRKGKILFTGSGGFFGRQFVPLLIRDGWEVISPRSKEINLENISVKKARRALTTIQASAFENTKLKQN